MPDRDQEYRLLGFIESSLRRNFVIGVFVLFVLGMGGLWVAMSKANDRFNQCQQAMIEKTEQLLREQLQSERRQEALMERVDKMQMAYQMVLEELQRERSKPKKR